MYAPDGAQTHEYYEVATAEWADFVVIEHSGRNELADGRRYNNNYCWVFRFQDGLIQEVREYMDTQLVTETFGPDGSS